ncbi:MAG: zf-HC2 domain-containing protein [Chloroflexi bacterium]|nr:zf-HC2 domain-containing protein [Chloroflexota bacterium]
MAHIDEFTLNEYLDEALSEAERNEVAGHLAHCAACQAAFTELQQLFFTLATMPDIPLFC